METQNRHRQAPAPLAVLITQAERQVLDRRRQIGDRARLLDRAIRTTFSSIRTTVSTTALLLLGGSIGVTAGYFSKRPASAPSSNVSPRRISPDALLNKALRWIAVSRLLTRVFLLVQHRLHRPDRLG